MAEPQEITLSKDGDEPSPGKPAGEDNSLAARLYREAYLIADGLVAGAFRQGYQSWSEQPLSTSAHLVGSAALGLGLAVAQRRAGVLRLGAQVAGAALGVEFAREILHGHLSGLAGSAIADTWRSPARLNENVAVMQRSAGDFAFRTAMMTVGGMAGAGLGMRLRPISARRQGGVAIAEAGAGTSGEVNLSVGGRPPLDLRLHRGEAPVHAVGALHAPGAVLATPDGALALTRMESLPGGVRIVETGLKSDLTATSGAKASSHIVLIGHYGGEAGVVLTGGPSVGKSTLIAMLEARGHRVLPEYATEVILEGKVLPWVDRKAFQKEWVGRQLAAERVLLESGQAGILDRGVFDGEAYALYHGLRNSELYSGLHKSRYGLAFLLEPLPTFEQNGIRVGENLEFTWELTRILEKVYAERGIPVVRVPAMKAEDRLAFILQQLSLRRPNLDYFMKLESRLRGR